MDRLNLVLTNLARKPTRTTLTFLTLMIAFLLFMLLRGVAAAFSGDFQPQGVMRLHVDARYSMTDNLPIAHVHSVREAPGVWYVTPVIWFGGYYQQPGNAFAKLVIDPEAFFNVYPEIEISDAGLQRFRGSRRAVVVADVIAERFGWAVGDLVPIRGDIWPKADNSWDWAFEIAATYSVAEGSRVQPAFLIQHEYFNESVMSWVQNQIGWMTVRLEAGAEPESVIDSIDALFENSADPTLSLSEDDYARQFANQLGDIGTITTLILIAVFFTILLMTANVISLSYRERVPELAVMKTLGFQDGYVSSLVLAESVLLCALGALAGITLALLVEPALNARLSVVLGTFQMRGWDILSALAIALGMGLFIGLPAANAARRLPIVEALREIH